MIEDKRQQKADGRKRKTGLPVLVPSPFPLAESWADRYPREISQAQAAKLTHRGRATARKWAQGEPIEPLCLTVLQLHLWGCIVPPAFRLMGIRFHGDRLHTRSDYPLDRFELSAVAWSLGNYRQAVQETERAVIPPPPRDRRWRPNRRDRRRH